MKFFTDTFINRPLPGWLLVIVLSIAPLLGFAGFRIAESQSAGWVPKEVIDELRATERQFKSNAPIVLVFQSEDFFQPAHIAALQHTAVALREIKEVLNLTWVGDIPEVSPRGRQRLWLPIVTNATSAQELVDAKQALVNHPLAANNLISSDGRTLLMLLDTNDKSLVSTIRSIAMRNLAATDIRVRVTGTLALYDLHNRALAGDHVRIQIWAYLLVGGLQILVFRRPIAIIIACSGPVVGVIWTLGWLKLIGQSENELAKIILPVMIVMIGFTDGVHFTLRLKQLRVSGSNVIDAARNALVQTGPACLLTSLTTAIGFGSLALSQSEMIAGFGYASAIGVIVTFFAVVLVSPLLAVSWLGRRMHVNHQQEPLARFISRFKGVIRFSASHARMVTIIGAAITVGCLVLCSRLIADERVSDRVPNQSEEWQAMHHCDRHVGGIRSLRVMLRWPENTSRKQIWPAIRECESLIAQQPLLGRPLSIRTALTVVRGSNRQDQSILANQLPESLKHQFYRPDIRSTIVVTRMQDLGFAALEPVLNELKSKLVSIETANPGFEVELLSDVIVEGKIVSQLIREMMQSLMMAAAIIFMLLAISFHSWQIGLISIIPNVMPLAVSGALQYCMVGSLGIAATCSFAICLGIAVDDTIHYLHHFRSERRKGSSSVVANQRTFVAVGSALMLTTIVITAGLGTVMTSQLPPHVSFASMACVTLIVALPADLLFLPALLTLLPGRVTEADSVTKAPSAVKLTQP
ncbi:efflux RND transporter permease subunit [Fuerstiella marisgermanici]|uniref:Efflux transporter, putative, hydrophobe/amphiphile efflux-3 (HAE3) family n=1 Tax=Fuerstiella marisgermanici TaxID=1891926 RepID=A0A1P8WNG7_9PLAN|nr:MMPL family transporter [Fuerstiella marisgermanici]APZ95600.1 efflux transporter, putative, hydrophobe/amphiphile efflux-3 (HAE3) family [Fuerstiella marisgermanici]